MATAETSRFATHCFAPTATKASPLVNEAPSTRELIYQITSGGQTRIVSPPATLVSHFGGISQIAIHSAATFFLILLAGLTCLAAVPNFIGYQSVVVTSGSMEPSIRTADVVVTSTTDGLDLRVGTVINHTAFENATLHRIVEITELGYRTSGDANSTADSVIVAPDQVAGIGTVVVPFVGYPALWIQEGQWHLVLAFLVGIIGVGYAARPSWLRKTDQW
jgi:signal peptidase I